ncbi:PAS domain S-box protein [Streptomyces sp. NPDC059717]|uniref:PAS domain S-box protein n=1 Tax=Streptomyces sp. NPDC059717 TaxID=3346922 RepID=UPI0036AEFBE7
MGVGVDEALMSVLFAAADAGLYAVDDEGTVIACNPGAERLLGYAPGTLIGVNAHRTLHPSNEESAAVPVQRPILQDVTRGERAVLRRADGTPLAVWWTTAPLPTGVRRGRGAVVVFQDATAQREREGRRDERYALSETMREQAEYDLAETT